MENQYKQDLACLTTDIFYQTPHYFKRQRSFAYALSNRLNRSIPEVNYLKSRLGFQEMEDKDALYMLF